MTLTSTRRSASAAKRYFNERNSLVILCCDRVDKGEELLVNRGVGRRTLVGLEEVLRGDVFSIRELSAIAQRDFVLGIETFFGSPAASAGKRLVVGHVEFVQAPLPVPVRPHGECR